MKKNVPLTIISELYENDNLNLSALIKLAGGQKDAKKIKKHLAALIESGIITLSKGNYRLAKRKSVFKAEIVRVFRAHGFIKDISSGNEFFVPGKYLCGGVPGDIVLARPLEKETDAVRVIAIIEESQNTLIGTVVKDGGGLCLRPDSFVCDPLLIKSFGKNDVKEGDKVSFCLCERGANNSSRHGDYMASILSVYGNADVARVAVKAYLDEKAIPAEFPHDVRDEAAAVAARGISAAEKSGRTDLTALPIFTIDGADTKDIDDAVCVAKTTDGYELGVHIADVSYYVRRNSPLDKEAFLRGTSVYIADLVVPMLPKELSNGICSLNPAEERLAFSCLMKLSLSGRLESFEFVKSVIKSRVQGVYSEINAMLGGEIVPDDIREKYADVSGQFEIMKELAAILAKNREGRGAPAISSKETKVVCDENGVCKDIKPRSGGVAEGIIEEFMLTANNAAAKLAMDNEIPFIYRIHEAPTAEKLLLLSEALVLLGVNAKGINEQSAAADLARVLSENKDHEKFEVINNLVLRSMMKAAYSPDPLGHFGLVMKEYSHFTSPIRRYPDLFIHRVLSDYIEKTPAEKLNKRFRKQSYVAAARSSSTELAAVNAERDCVKFYMAEYMIRNGHVGEEFDGIISGVAKSGIFVLLENTIEGRVGAESLTGGLYADFEVVNNIVLKSTLGNQYTVGDKVRVRCMRASIALGLIDFELVKYYSRI